MRKSRFTEEQIIKVTVYASWCSLFLILLLWLLVDDVTNKICTRRIGFPRFLDGSFRANVARPQQMNYLLGLFPQGRFVAANTVEG
jgi:hypothetical protein